MLRVALVLNRGAPVCGSSLPLLPLLLSSAESRLLRLHLLIPARPPARPAPAGSDPSAAMEQLCWLTAMCGHVLADAGEGETPLAPLPIVQACEAAAAAAAAGSGAPPPADPAERLSGGLLAVGEHCLAHAGQPGASPRQAGRAGRDSGCGFGWKGCYWGLPRCHKALPGHGRVCRTYRLPVPWPSLQDDGGCGRVSGPLG